MADLDKNGVLDELEIAAYKEQASANKFKQQISYGVGAAMVFGLFSGLSGLLLEGLKWQGIASLSSMAFMGPVLGAAALGLVGVGMLYLSAKFLSENTLLDQAIQAKQIGRATAAQAQQQAVPAVEAPSRPQNFPATATAALDEADAPETAPAETKWAEKFAGREASSPAAAITAKAEDGLSWEAKLAAAAANDAGREANGAHAARMG